MVFLSVSLFAIVKSEPPVQGYHYEPNNYNLNSYNAPSNTYLPPKTGLSLPNSYLPPNSFTSGNVDRGHNHGQAGHRYDHESEVVSKDLCSFTMVVYSWMDRRTFGEILLSLLSF
ncbi:unnamed protein product, partial [Brenthis ino]